MKNRFLPLLCIMLCLSLMACSKPSDNEPTKTSVPSQSTESTVPTTTVTTSTEESTVPELAPAEESTTVETTTALTEIFIEETDPSQTYSHVGITGAVVTDYDGTGRYTFVKMCESCGKEQLGSANHHSWGGTYHGSFTCAYCHETQEFEIETNED